MRVSKSDIANVGSAVKSALSNEVSETSALINHINNFINGSNSELDGPAWTREKEVFESYIPLLEKRSEIASEIITCMEKANNIMNGYIDGYPDGADELNTEKINEMNQLISQIYSEMYDLKQKAKNNKTQVPNMGQYEEEIAKLQLRINYLKRMPEFDSNAYDSYASVSSAISSFKGLIDSQNVSKF